MTTTPAYVRNARLDILTGKLLASWAATLDQAETSQTAGEA